MSRKSRQGSAYRILGLLFVAAALAASCSPGTPSVGSQTNWMRLCDSSDECEGLQCICGACTRSCAAQLDCQSFEGASCVVTEDPRAAAFCGGTPPAVPICLSSCVDGCGDDSSCVAGVCVPSLGESARVVVDTSLRYQTLTGFGASLAYEEDAIVAHPAKQALYDAMFSDSGLDVIRLRNRYEAGKESELDAPREIIEAARARMARAPVIFMTSGSPPPELKANGDRYCNNSNPDCTLTRDGEGRFDYGGFASYWRASLQAYADAGILPQFVSLQSHPDYIPPDQGVEACRFLPTEGTARMSVGEETIDAPFPGYAEALTAVKTALAGADLDFSFAAPEVGSPILVSRYASSLNADDFGALAFQFYGTTATSIDVELLEGVRSIEEQLARPSFQSEMHSAGLETAVLTHYALTAAGVSSYLQHLFVVKEAEGEDPEKSGALIARTDESFETRPPFHALAHYARSTDPGWVRVAANQEEGEILSSAWMSPDGAALTIVIVNPSEQQFDAEIVVPDRFTARLATAEVTRTVFGGVERSAALGPLPESRLVRVPGGSIVTVALPKE